MCYQVKVAKGQAKTVPVTGIAITNQILEIGVDAIKEDMLCVPATKTL